MEGISEKEILETINAHLPRRERNPLPHDLELSRSAREALVLTSLVIDTSGMSTFCWDWSNPGIAMQVSC